MQKIDRIESRAGVGRNAAEVNQMGSARFSTELLQYPCETLDHRESSGDCSISSQGPTQRTSIPPRCCSMAAPQISASKMPTLKVSAASSSTRPITRSQSQALFSGESHLSCDVFGKEVAASDHVTAIDALLKRKQKMTEEKRALQKELRAAQRRRQRLKRKAKELSQEDLVAVLLMREKEDLSKRLKAEGKETPAEENPEGSLPGEGEPAPKEAAEECADDSPSG